MKVALLLPGYLDSPDYLHLKTFGKRLIELGYFVERLDPCYLWETNDIEHYTVTNILDQVKTRIDCYTDQKPSEIIIIGHSLGGFVSVVASNKYPEISKIIALCPPLSIDNLGKKWKGEPLRSSKRDLPEDSSKFREFNIPLTFVADAQKYSATEALHNMTKPLMILIALADTSIDPKETEVLVANANNPHVVRVPDMGHDFRKSQAECDLVMSKIEEFLTK